jgi:hypothetical protein
VSRRPPLHARRLPGTSHVLSPLAVLLPIAPPAAGRRTVVGVLRAVTSFSACTTRHAGGLARLPWSLGWAILASLDPSSRVGCTVHWAKSVG